MSVNVSLKRAPRWSISKLLFYAIVTQGRRNHTETHFLTLMVCAAQTYSLVPNDYYFVQSLQIALTGKTFSNQINIADSVEKLLNQHLRNFS